MKVLLVGNGAREHIIAEKLSQDCDLYSVMSKRNPAIYSLSKESWTCNIEDPNSVLDAIKGMDFDLAFASPDATLAAGVSDALLAKGMLVASPTKAASRIEWDKSFMRTFLSKHKIPGSPNYELVRNASDAMRVIKDYGDVAIKPLGLTGGKGVKVSGDHFTEMDDGLSYVNSLLSSDGCALIEEKLIGEEFTLQAFSDGLHISVMPPVQDHKRAFENDAGKNTGGMGSYSTGPLLSFMDQKDLEQGKKILADVVYALKKDGSPFQGVLYGQFMATEKGVKVVEFNARFGDPEAINVLSLLEDSLTDMFLSIAEGQLINPKFSSDCTVVKYLVPDGYPDNPISSSVVEPNVESIEKCGAKIYFASVYENAGKIYTTSSRSFGILGKAKTLEEAERISEEASNMVRGPVWHRKDIGTKELVRKRVERMKSLRLGHSSTASHPNKSSGHGKDD